MTANADDYQPVRRPSVRLHMPIASAAVVARRDEEQARLVADEARAAAALAARLTTMPMATADLAARVTRCRQLRAADRCPGQCVITGLPHSHELLRQP